MGITLLGCYRDEEISEAKQVLIEFVDSLDEKPKGLKLYKKKRPENDNWRKLEIDDTLEVFAVLDAANVNFANVRRC